MARRYFLFVIFFVLSGFFISSFSGELYPFHSIRQRQQFKQLTQELRCLVCQNENLASSNAPLAADLRKQVYIMIQQGRSSKQIKSYLVNRYGDFILFDPPINLDTLVLWGAPFLFIFFGFFILYRVSRPKSRND